MPKRTNDFQDLVSLVQKSLVPSGAKITDSALLEIPGLSEPREIDVLIETAIGPYSLKIAVEAKDHRRKMDSTQFESLMGKYLVEGGVKVNKVVIVTKNGFFEPVIERAKRLGVELLTLIEAKKFNWSQFGALAKPFKTYPRICDFDISPPITDMTEEQILQNGKVYCSHGKDYGSVQQFAKYLLREDVFRNHQNLLRQLDSAAALDPKGKKGKVEFTPDHPHVIQLSERVYPLEKLAFNIHFSKDNIPPQDKKPELHFRFDPHVCRIEVVPPIAGITPNELRTEARLVCTCCGKDSGTLIEWATKAVIEGVFKRNFDIVSQFREGVRQSPTGEAWLNAEWKIQDKKVVRFRGSDYPVITIAVGVHAVSATSNLEAKCYELMSPNGESQQLSYLEATAGGKKFQIVVPHVEGGFPDKIVLKIDEAK